MTQEMMTVDQTYMPAMSIPQAVQRFNTLVEFVQTVMRNGVDYGTIPNTPKPTLLKAGAEKLTTLFGLTTRFSLVEQVEDWGGEQHGGEPFFYYWYRCSLSRGERLIAEADGSCNSRESKYRWRWVSLADVPAGLNAASLTKRGGTISEFTFAVDKAETGGKYGKPAEYWEAFKSGIDQGTARLIKRKTNAGKEMDAWEIDSTMYRVPNEDIASQVNTVQKMAQKRAFVAVTLIGVNASEFFTQDIEDLDLIGNGTSYVPPVAVAPIVIGTKASETTTTSTQPTDDLIDLPEFAAAVKKLRDTASAIGITVPAFTRAQAKDRTALELEWIDSRRRLYTWLIEHGPDNGSQADVPDLIELDDKGLMDLAYAAAGL